LVEAISRNKDRSPIDPDWLTLQVVEALPRNAILVDEGLTASRYLPALLPYRDRHAYHSLASGGIGWGLPGAVGASLANPDRPVVCYSGDGSAMYSFQALWTAAHHKLPLTVVIVNNGGYRIIKQRLLSFHKSDRFIGMDFVDPRVDFSGLAKALGVEAIRVTDAKAVIPTLTSAFNRPPLVVVPDDINGAYTGSADLDRLKAVARVVIHETRPRDEADLMERVRPANAILSFRPAFTRFPADVLRAAPELRLVCISGTGVEDVDVAEATRRGIAVANVVGSANRAVAELCVALMFAVARAIPVQDRSVRSGTWKATPGIELGGKTLGIVGLSGISSELILIARALGMRVVSWSRNNDPTRAKSAGATAVALDDLLAQADVVSLHLRLNAETRNFLNAGRFACMKRGAILINTARGGLVDELALFDALRSGRLGGAGLDVFSVEPVPAASPLLAMENVVMTPVSGWNTRDASHRMIAGSIDNVVGFFMGKPQNVVNGGAK
jgi:phosphoglycerate dehydrogenase-like enzyme